MPRKRKIKSFNSLPLASLLPKIVPTHASRYPLPHTAPVLLANGIPVLGAGQLHSTPIQRFIDLSLTPAEVATIQALDAAVAPSVSLLAQTAAVLADHGVSLEISALVLGKPDGPTVSRLISLSKHPAILSAMDKGLSLGHARELLKLPAPQRTYWLEHTLARNLSIRSLKSAISAKQRPQGIDTKHLETQLSEALSTQVALHWPAEGIKTLSLTYFGIEELQGLLEQLLRFAGNPPIHSKAIKREIQIQIADMDEFDALLGNAGLT